MNNTLVLSKEAILSNAIGTHTNGNTKPVWCITTKKYFTSLTDASEKTGINNGSISKACSGKYKTAGGLKWCFVADRDKHLDELATSSNHTNEEYDQMKKELEALKKENETLRVDASLGRAIKAELEKERKAKEALEFRKQKANKRLAKAEQKVINRQRLMERKGKEYEASIASLEEAKREKGAIELEILKLEGKVK